ncbi:MAG: FkbM family methyltransferase [Actinomycetota bacterium]|nr:FkbM family methyltransferase [Actinomycetota bacterium]
MTAPPGRSYQGQDRWVIEALDGMRGGFFLDSGASDGLSGSNTKLLEDEFGWRGICVEPNEELFARLVQHRRCACVNCCLYDRDGEVEFFEAAGVYGGIMEAYDPGFLRYARHMAGEDGSANGRPRTTTKPARTLRSLLREHGAPPVIDYWSLDTEGSELAILRSFPFDEYRFRVLTVEHNLSPSREPIRAFLEGRGYTRAGSLGIDDCYVWAGRPATRAWRSAAWSRT